MLKEDTIFRMQAVVHGLAVENGWWDEDRKVLELLMLCVSELAEAAEAWRNGDEANLAEELADTVIRIMDMSERMCFDLGSQIARKHEKNRARPYRHGGKKA